MSTIRKKPHDEFIFRANPKYWNTLQSLRAYITNGQKYIYWAAPQHSPRIQKNMKHSAGGTQPSGGIAYIYLGGVISPKRVIAVGEIVEGPTDISTKSVGGFKYPQLVTPTGWSEKSAKSSIKVGIRLDTVNWNGVPNCPTPKGHQTVELI
jgi:hypothetical protein